VVLGRTRTAHKSLSVQFQDRAVSKRYEALVRGWPREDSGAVDAAIGKWRGGGAARWGGTVTLLPRFRQFPYEHS
jgi:23S rRNA-/tRNA-specific pseudouridylate synthase